MNPLMKKSRYPRTIFFMYLLGLVLIYGLHFIFFALINVGTWPIFWRIAVPLVYIVAVAIAMTAYTHWRISEKYDKPMIELANATKQIAEGDFSVSVDPVHKEGKQDYLDEMILDFDKMANELGNIETLKVDFFTNVSHEYKTPLSVIQNNAEMIRYGCPSEEEIKESAESIYNASKRLSNLISNMLRLNNLEKNSISPTSKEYDLCAQLCDCAVEFSDIWEKKNISFDADIEDTVKIESDAGLLEIVWSNLFSNAFKFTPVGGAVSLFERSSNTEVIVKISDTGCGMNDETKKHIFDKFYQGDQSHSTEGNGLGLALVGKILELTGGRIDVSSTLNKGSTFTVNIPRKLVNKTTESKTK